MVGDSERALDQLEAAVDQRVGMLAFLSRDPALDPLRAHPRFRAIVARLNAASQ